MRMSNRIAGTVLAATALMGCGVGAASAALASAPPAKAGDVVVFNATPWAEWIYDNNDNNYTTVDSGQTATFTAADIKTKFPTGQMRTYNTYSTLTSIVHLTGYQPGVNSCAIDGDQYNVGCIIQTPNLLIGEHSPTQISIWATNPNETQPIDFDASDPGADRTAMGNFLSGIATLQPSWITFGPDADPVTWGSGPQDLAGPVVRNCDAGDANEQIGGGSTHEESTSVTGTVSVTQGLNFLDLVDTQVSASISVGHTWTTSTETNYSVNKTIPSNYVGWMTSTAATMIVTGTVTMNGNSPVPINFHNVSFAEPGINQTGNPDLDYSYTAHSQAMTPDQIQQFCGSQPPGVGTLNAAQTHAFLATVSPTTTDQ